MSIYSFLTNHFCVPGMLVQKAINVTAHMLSQEQVEIVASRIKEELMKASV